MQEFGGPRVTVKHARHHHIAGLQVQYLANVPGTAIQDAPAVVVEVIIGGQQQQVHGAGFSHSVSPQRERQGGDEQVDLTAQSHDCIAPCHRGWGC